MKKSRIEIIHPDNEEDLKKLDHFCKENSIPCISEDIKEKNKKKEPFLFDLCFSLMMDNKIKDYCMFHGENDIKKGFLTFPDIDGDEKDRILLMKYAIKNPLTMGLETLFVSTKDKKMGSKLQSLGFLTLSSEDEEMQYYLYEMNEKGLEYETFKTK